MYIFYFCVTALLWVATSLDHANEEIFWSEVELIFSQRGSKQLQQLLKDDSFSLLGSDEKGVVSAEKTQDFLASVLEKQLSRGPEQLSKQKLKSTFLFPQYAVEETMTDDEVDFVCTQANLWASVELDNVWEDLFPGREAVSKSDAKKAVDEFQKSFQAPAITSNDWSKITNTQLLPRSWGKGPTELPLACKGRRKLVGPFVIAGMVGALLVIPFVHAALDQWEQCYKLNTYWYQFQFDYSRSQCNSKQFWNKVLWDFMVEAVATGFAALTYISGGATFEVAAAGVEMVVVAEEVSEIAPIIGRSLTMSLYPSIASNNPLTTPRKVFGIGRRLLNLPQTEEELGL